MAYLRVPKLGAVQLAQTGSCKKTVFQYIYYSALQRFVKLVIFMGILAAEIVKCAYIRARGEIAAKKINAH
jgi:hypothetical protein